MNTAQRIASHGKRKFTADPGAWIKVIARNQEQPEWNADQIMVKIRTAFELLKTGHATDAHFDRVAGAMNIGMLRAELIDPLVEHTMQAGIEAMYGCAGIHERHGRYGFTGQGLLAMNDAIDLYGEILRQSTPRQMEDAKDAAYRRVIELARKISA